MSNLFEEKQKFNQWWLWVILLSFPIISVGPFDDNEINVYYVLIGLLIPVSFYLFELRIKVNKESYNEEIKLTGLSQFFINFNF